MFDQKTVGLSLAVIVGLLMEWQEHLTPFRHAALDAVSSQPKSLG